VYWTLLAYFAVRALPYQGESAAPVWLKEHDPEVYQGIQQFYTTPDLAEKPRVSERVAELVLAPVGGHWRQGEVLVYAAHEEAAHL
jgi:hypothetical protein